jgi:hypothetical protein
VASTPTPTEEPPKRQVPWRPLVAIVVALMAAAGLAFATQRPISTDDSPTPPIPAPSPPVRSPAAQATPLAWVADPRSELQCRTSLDGFSSFGGPVYGGNPEGPFAGTAKAAVEALLDRLWYTNLPYGEYEEIGRADPLVLYGYRRDDRVVAVVSLRSETAERDQWSLSGAAGCDPSEFGPDIGLTGRMLVWADASGNTAHTSALVALPGPRHCQWESAIWLDVRLDGREGWYVRDPEGVLESFVDEPYLESTTMPAGATDSGFHAGELSLWWGPDDSAVYMVVGDSIERWPASNAPVGCA